MRPPPAALSTAPSSARRPAATLRLPPRLRQGVESGHTTRAPPAFAAAPGPSDDLPNGLPAGQPSRLKSAARLALLTLGGLTAAALMPRGASAAAPELQYR